MNTSLHSEIYSKNLDMRFDVVINEMKNMQIVASIPLRKGEAVLFSPEDELSMSYFFGHFKYSFDVHYVDSITKNDITYYRYDIVNSDIDNNYRKEQRKNVEYRAVYWTPDGISFAMILDISPSGLRIRTDKPFNGKTIELYFNEKETKGTQKLKGDIKWKKTLNEKFEYGIALKK